MLDIKFVRENPEAVKKGARDKHFKAPVDEALALDALIRDLRIKVEVMQAQRNSLSKEIAKARPAERATMIGQVNTIKIELPALEMELSLKERELNDLMLMLPAPARKDVPVGATDADNVEIKTWGKLPNFAFEPKSHVDIAMKMGGLDLSNGVKLAGSRSYILKGDAARLEQAVLRYTYDFLVKKGYNPHSVPVLVKEDAMVGTGYFPLGRDQAYIVEKDEMALVGTAEVPLVGMYANELLSFKDLPLRLMALTPCFRREAGSYGKDTSGLYRVHQFYKIEQVIIAPQGEEESEQLHNELLQNAEQILQDFEIPYRVVYVCTGDLGQGQVRKHDIESWMPSRNAYGETHSCSTFHDFQARRLKIRYKTATGENQVCFTLNNTAIATPRALISLLECHQTADGKVKIPLKLRPYLDGAEFVG